MEALVWLLVPRDESLSNGREAEQQADSRNWLRDYIFNHKHEAERTWKGQGL